MCIRLDRSDPGSFKATGLQNARSHMWKFHRIGAPPDERKSEAQLESEVIPSQPSIITHFKLDVSQQQDQQMTNTLIQSFNKQYFHRLLVELIVSTNLPFRLVDNGVFRKLLEYLNLSVRIRRAIPSSPTIRRTIYQQYYKHRETVINLLHKSPGKIHISFDGWTSLNQAALYGIVCFFRDEQNQL
jgi:hypothetical protein